MKRHISQHIDWFLGASFIFLLTGLLAACHSKAQWNDLDFYQVEKEEKLCEDAMEEDEREDEHATLHSMEKRRMDVKVDMQFIQSNKATNERVCKLINDQLIEVLLKQSSELSAEEAVEQYIEDVKAEFHGDKVANVYHDHLTGRAEYGIDNIINYRMREDVFTGGAHPCTITTILRFNALTGEFITLDQVFPSMNQHKLQDLLLAKLMRNNDAHSMDDLHKKGILEMTDMFVSNNFAMREDSIEFYYNEYDIAPYAYGAYTLCVGYDEVRDLMATAIEKSRK